MSNSNVNQYSNSNTLQIRGELHKKYSVNPEPWINWLFKQYNFTKGSSILEFGCGTGILWKDNIELIDPSWKILLTDFSDGMLETAKINIERRIRNISYLTCNIENTSEIKSSFDAIIANHMLYHVNNLDLAFQNIIKLLNPQGTFYASTIGNSNFKEMAILLKEFTGSDKYQQLSDATAKSFSLANGKIHLNKYFNNIEIRKHEDGLLINDAKPLVDYILTLNNMVDGLAIIKKEEISALTVFLQNIIKTQGNIFIQKEVGTFICRNE